MGKGKCTVGFNKFALYKEWKRENGRRWIGSGCRFSETWREIDRGDGGMEVELYKAKLV
jgi:hypothetical protein